MEDIHSRRSVLKGVGAAGALATTGVSGCLGAIGGSDSDDGEYSIGFQVGGLGNSWFTALARAGEWYGEANGMNVNIGDGELDPTTQVQVARNLTNSGIDALIVNPFDSEAMASAVDQAANRDIPTFSVDSVATSSDLKLYTAFGNFSAGQRAAENAVQQLEQQTGSPEGDLVEVMIEQSAELGVARHEGTVAGVEEYDDVNIVGEIVTNNTRQDTSEKVYNYLQENPDVDGFVCHAVTTSNGTLNALERHNMKVPRGEDDHLVFSQIDAGPESLTAIRDGFVDVAIDQPVHFYAPITMHYIKEYLDADKDDSALPSVGDTVETGAFTLESQQAQDATGQNIWDENVWAPAEVEETDAVDDVPWFHTNSVKVTQDNVDAPYLWGNWIKEVA